MNTTRDELSIEALLQFIIKHLQLVILPSVAGVLCMYILAAHLATPTYVSDFKISVYTRPELQTNPMGNLQADTYLVQDYAVVIKSRKVAERVIKELRLLQGDTLMDPNTLLGNVIVDPGDGTSRMITVSITNSDPFLAADIASEYGKVSLEVIKEMYGVDNIQIVDEASVPLKKYSPNTVNYMIYGFVLGMISGIGVLTILFMIENKIRI